MPKSSNLPPVNEQNSTATKPDLNGSENSQPVLSQSLAVSRKDSKRVSLKRKPRRNAALARFLKGTGIKPNQIETAPNLSGYFPNKLLLIDAIRFSQEPVVSDFLKVYDATPEFDRKRIPLEAVALKAQCDFNSLLGAMMFSFRAMQTQKSALIAMEAHPEVVAATAKFARKARGVQDRKMLHEAVGFLPTPKGASINLNFPGSKDDVPDSEPTTPEVDELFPMITQRQEKWQNDRTKMLEAKN